MFSYGFRGGMIIGTSLVLAIFITFPILLMADMVKSYVTREYTDVSPKVIISLVGAFVYLVKKNDIIPDNVPVIGFADDLAVATVAMAINEPELTAFAAWKADKVGEPIDLVPVEALEPAAPAEQAQPTQPAQSTQPPAQA